MQKHFSILLKKCIFASKLHLIQMTLDYPSSFEQLYKNYYPRLAAYASLFIKSDEAHDVVQDVFLSLLERKNKKIDETMLNAYLYKAVQNKCVDAIRHNTIKEQYTSDVGKMLLQMETDYFYTSRNEIEEGLLSQELQEQINSAIETLPPKGKEVFKLYFEHQKTAKDIASILNLSRSTIENHIYVCIKSLRKKLSKYLMTILFWNPRLKSIKELSPVHFRSTPLYLPEKIF